MQGPKLKCKIDGYEVTYFEVGQFGKLEMKILKLK